MLAACTYVLAHEVQLIRCLTMNSCACCVLSLVIKRKTRNVDLNKRFYQVLAFYDVNRIGSTWHILFCVGVSENPDIFADRTCTFSQISYSSMYWYKEEQPSGYMESDFLRFPEWVVMRIRRDPSNTTDGKRPQQHHGR